jgi:phage-related protein
LINKDFVNGGEVLMSYIRNVAKSFKYAMPALAKNLLPTAFDTYDQNKDFVKDTYAEAKRFFKEGTVSYWDILPDSINSIRKDLVQGVKNAKQDIKTGNLYNKERQEQAEKEAFKEYLGGDDSFDFDSLDDFNFDDDDDDFSDDVTESKSEGNTVNNNIIRNKKNIINNISNSIYNQGDNSTGLYSTLQTVKSTQSGFKGLGNLQVAATNSMLGGLQSISDTLNHTLEFHTSQTASFYEQSTVFFTSISGVVSEIANSVKDMKESSINFNKKPDLDLEYEEPVIDAEGKFNLQAYSKKVRSKFKDDSGLFDDIGLFVKEKIANPIGEALVFTMKRLLPDAFKESMQNFNKVLLGLPSAFIFKMNEWANSDNFLKGFLGKIFGLSVELRKKFEFSDYEKGAIPFDGITKRSITHVIPSLLGKILSALKGDRDELVYNFDKGEFTTKETIQKEVEISKDRAVSMNYFEDVMNITDAIKDQNREITYDQMKNIEGELSKVFKGLTLRGKLFTGDMEEMKDIDVLDDYKKVVSKYFTDASPERQFDFTRRMFSSVSDWNNVIKSAEMDKIKGTATAYDTQNINLSQNYLNNAGLAARGKTQETMDVRIVDTIYTPPNKALAVYIVDQPKKRDRMRNRSGDIVSPQGTLDLPSVINMSPPSTSQLGVSDVSGLNFKVDRYESGNIMQTIKDFYSEIIRKNDEEHPDDNFKSNENVLRDASRFIGRKFGRERRDTLLRDLDPNDPNFREEINRRISRSLTEQEMRETTEVNTEDQEKGILEKIRGLYSKPFDWVSKQVNRLNYKLAEFFFGKKVRFDGDGNPIINEETGQAERESLFDRVLKPFEGIKQNFDDISKSVKNWLTKDLKLKLDKFLFGEKDEDGNLMEGSKGVVNVFKDKLNTVKDSLSKFFFGDDTDGSKTAGIFGKETQKRFKELGLKSSAVGAGAGILASMFLPGGPISGAIIGAGVGLMYQTETVQSFLWGKTDPEGNIIKKGLMNELKEKYIEIKDDIKEFLFGPEGKISPEMKAKFEKFGMGAGVGVLASMFLPGGPLLWSLLGMAHQTETAQKFLYDKQNGVITKMGNELKKVGKKINNYLLGEKDEESGGYKTIGVLRHHVNVFKTYFNRAQDKVNKFLFGNEEAETEFKQKGLINFVKDKVVKLVDDGKKFLFGEKDAEGNLIKEGIFSSIIEFSKKEIWQPLKDTIKADFERVKNWFKESIVKPLQNVFKPFIEEFKYQMKAFGNWSKNLFMDGMKAFKNAADSIFESTFGKPLSQMMREYVIQPIKDVLGSIKESVGKILGSILKFPVNIIKGISDDLRKKHEERGMDYTRETEKVIKKGKQRSAEREIQVRDRATRMALNRQSRLEQEASTRDSITDTVLPTIETPEITTPDITTPSSIMDTVIPEVSTQERLVDLQTSSVNIQERIADNIQIQGNSTDKVAENTREIVNVTQSNLSEIGTTIKEIYSAVKNFFSRDKKASTREVIPSMNQSRFGGLEDSTSSDDINRRILSERIKGSLSRERRLAREAGIDFSRGLINEENLREDLSRIGASRISSTSSRKDSEGSNLDSSGNPNRFLAKIAKAVDGQLDGVGYNVNKIRRILERHYGTIDNLDQMVGSGNKKPKGFFGKLMNIITSPFRAVRDFIGNSVSKIKNGVTKVFDTIGNTGKRVIDGISNIAKSVFKGIGKVASTILDGVKSAFKLIPEIGKAIGHVLSAVGSIVANIAKGVFSAVSSIVSALGNAISHTINALGSVAKTLVSTIGSAIGAIAKFAGSLIEMTVKAIPAVLKGLGKLVGAIAKTTWEFLSFLGRGARSVFTGIKNLFSRGSGSSSGSGRSSKGGIQDVRIVDVKANYLTAKPLAVYIVPAPENLMFRLAKGKYKQKKIEEKIESTSSAVKGAVVGSVMSTVDDIEKKNIRETIKLNLQQFAAKSKEKKDEIVAKAKDFKDSAIERAKSAKDKILENFSNMQDIIKSKNKNTEAVKNVEGGFKNIQEEQKIKVDLKKKQKYSDRVLSGIEETAKSTKGIFRTISKFASILGGVALGLAWLFSLFKKFMDGDLFGAITTFLRSPLSFIRNKITTPFLKFLGTGIRNIFGTMFSKNGLIARGLKAVFVKPFQKGGLLFGIREGFERWIINPIRGLGKEIGEKFASTKIGKLLVSWASREKAEKIVEKSLSKVAGKTVKELGEAGAERAFASSLGRYAPGLGREAIDRISSKTVKTGTQQISREIIEGKVARQAARVIDVSMPAKQAYKAGVKSLGKSTAKQVGKEAVILAGKEAAKQGIEDQMKKGILPKLILGVLEKHGAKVGTTGLSSKLVQSISNKVASNLAAKVAAKAGTRAAATGLSFGASELIFAGVDFIRGLGNVRRIFQIGKDEEVTAGQRVAAGLGSAISNSVLGLYGLIDPGGVKLSKLIYEFTGGEEEKKMLAAKQEVLRQRAEAAGMSVEDYIRKTDPSLGQRIWDTGKNIGTKVKEFGGTKAGKIVTSAAMLALPGVGSTIAGVRGASAEVTRQNLGMKEGVKVTAAQRGSSAIGEILSKMSFGILDNSKTSKFIYGVLLTIGDKLKLLWDWTKNVAGKIWEGIKTGIGKIWDVTKWVGEKIWGGIKWVGEKIWGGIKWVGDKIWGGLKWIGTGISNVVKGVLSIPGKIGNFIKELPAKIGGFFSNTLGKFFTKFIDVVDKVFPIKKVIQIISDFVEKTVNKVTGFLSPIINKIKDFFKPITDLFSKVVKGVGNAVKSFGESLPDWIPYIKDLRNKLSNFGSDMINRAKEGVKEYEKTAKMEDTKSDKKGMDPRKRGKRSGSSYEDDDYSDVDYWDDYSDYDDSSSSNGSRVNYGSQLGSLSAKYESSGRIDTIANNKGDQGGASYGKYQIATNTGTMNSFLSYAKKQNEDIYNKLTGRDTVWGKAKGFFGYDVKPGTNEFNQRWKEIAKEDPRSFENLQHKFIQSSHYDPALEKIKKSVGIDVSQRSDALKDVLWSTAVQHGVGGANKVFSKALGSNANSLSDREIIERIYAERGRDKGYAHFSGNSASVIKSVVNRFEREKKDALTMLARGNTMSADSEIGAGVEYEDLDYDYNDSEPSTIKNGIPYYNQADKRWANILYTSVNDKSQTMASSGCGPTAMASVLSAYAGDEISPVDLATWSLNNGFRTKDKGTAHSFFKAIGSKYGVDVLEVGKDRSDLVIKSLSEGKPVIAAMGKGTFTKNGHFITLVGIDSNGNIDVLDPASVSKSTKYSSKIIFSEGQKFFMTSKDGKGPDGVKSSNVDYESLSEDGLEMPSQPSLDYESPEMSTEGPSEEQLRIQKFDEYMNRRLGLSSNVISPVEPTPAEIVKPEISVTESKMVYSSASIGSEPGAVISATPAPTAQRVDMTEQATQKNATLSAAKQIMEENRADIPLLSQMLIYLQEINESNKVIANKENTVNVYSSSNTNQNTNNTETTSKEQVKVETTNSGAKNIFMPLYNMINQSENKDTLMTSMGLKSNIASIARGR